MQEGADASAGAGAAADTGGWLSVFLGVTLGELVGT